MKLHSTILQTCTLFFTFLFVGDAVNVTAIGSLLDIGVFQCNASVILRCIVNPNTFLVQWNVGKGSRSTDSDCIGTGCSPSNSFPGRYIYSYDKSHGISNLTITHVKFDDDKMEYECYDGSLKDVYTVSIKGPPAADTTSYRRVNKTNSAEVTINTDCIYPYSDLNLVWYSTPVGGGDYKQLFAKDPTSLTCTKTDDCVFINASVQVSSSLTINTTSGGTMRRFGVQISFLSKTFNLTVGDFEVSNEDSTGVTDELSVGEIIGIAFGALALVGLIVFCIFAATKWKSHERVQAGPDTPKDFTVKYVSDTSATFTCMTGVNLTGQELTLCYSGIVGEEEDIVMTKSILVAEGGQTTLVTANNLKPRHQYKCYLFATDSKGVRSKTSADLVITTQGKPDPPADLMELKEETTSRSVSICWRPGKYGRKGQRFVIMYGLSKKKLERIKWKKETLLDDTRREILSYKINGLTPGKRYAITVSAQNDFGSTDVTSRPLTLETNSTKEDEDRPSEDEGSALNYHQQKELITNIPANLHAIL